MEDNSTAVGSLTVVAAAVHRVILGFVPRYIRVINVNNLTFSEFFYGMTAGTSLDTANNDTTQISVNAADGITLYTGRAAGATITGTATTNGTTTLTGSGTNFIADCPIGSKIAVGGETRTVTAVASATSLTVDSAFTSSAAGQSVFDVDGQSAGFSLGTDICDTASDVVRYFAVR